MQYNSISIIIPVYNEEKTVVELLDKLQSTKLSLKKEIIIVNDGSIDSSEKLIKEWISGNTSIDIKYFSKENGGKGSAVRHGIERSSGDVVIIQDADLEYNPEDIDLCIKPIMNGSSKIVYGSRELSGEKREYSYLSFFLGGLLVTNWINFLFGTSLTDEPTCYKTFDGNLIRTISFKGDGFDWEPEITARLIKLGYKIEEVGIRYEPRNMKEGKKINSLDGFKALFVALCWRFKSIGNDNRKIINSGKGYLIKGRKKSYFFTLLLLFLIAFSVRFAVAVPGLNNPLKNFSRPDTSTYVNPALSLLENGKYEQMMNGRTSYAYRPPGYPFFLACALFLKDSFKLPVILSCILSALSCIFIFKIGLGLGSRWLAYISSLFMIFNVTSMAHAPLLLSDTLFMFMITLQFWYFIKFSVSGRPLFLFLSIVLASLSAYIRTVELLWIIPCIVLIIFSKHFSFRKKLYIPLLAILAFCLPLMPWMIRNYYLGSGFTISTDSGNLLYHNGAVLLSKIENKSPEFIREKLHRKTLQHFERNPDKFRTEGKRTDYEKKQLLKLISEHPFTYISLCFRPWILLPDIPTFLQNLGLSQHGRGTFDVLNTEGIIAATRHYFQDKLWLLAFSLPLILIALVTYLGCMMQFICWIIKRKWYWVLMTLAFVEYYLFLPGPITMPRYQLPALPMICIMAGVFYSKFISHKKIKS